MVVRCLLSLVFCVCIACAHTGGPPHDEQAKVVSSAEGREQLARGYFEIGQGYAVQGDSVRAEEYLSLALKLGYPPERALPRLLRVCLDSGRLRAALSYAEPRSKDHPGDLALRQLIAAIHFGLGDAASASTELEAILAQAPSFAPAHYLLAVIDSIALGDSDAAAFHYRAYLDLEPEGSHRAEAASWLNARHPVPPTFTEQRP